MQTKGRNLPPVLRALRSRNYRLFFAGQGISLIGTWMTQVATIWLVYSLTNSALFLGLVGFASQIPSFLVAPFGGVVVDRTNRQKFLLYCLDLMNKQAVVNRFAQNYPTILSTRKPR